ncbi:MAG: HU family DNA-binding protein [Bacteroidetes bacterium]|jgi:DNA-binding protein HU-beta|nr:HU family DNA-binding protein [Bacteroidota bacterium]
MNKAQMIDSIAKSAKLTKVKSKDALDSIMTIAKKTLGKGQKISLVGFGTFSVYQKAARKGRNPQTGKEIRIPARKVVKFKASKKLKA